VTGARGRGAGGAARSFKGLNARRALVIAFLTFVPPIAILLRALVADNEIREQIAHRSLFAREKEEKMTGEEEREGEKREGRKGRRSFIRSCTIRGRVCRANRRGLRLRGAELIVN